MDPRLQEEMAKLGWAWSEQRLLASALALGARDVPGWSSHEERLSRRQGEKVPASLTSVLRDLVRSGADPLGDVFSVLRTPAERRNLGATYTPHPIVAAMVRWAQDQEEPERVVDPGVGSARFLLAAGQSFPKAALVGVEVDPLAAVVARANLAAAGLASRAHVILDDYRAVSLGASQRTLFIGNPPYVRHHQIDPFWKSWLVEKATTLGLHASQLAGLHGYFFLATALHAKEGDLGALITAAEWLDVNYGRLIRELFLNELGGQAIVVIEPTAMPFPDAATTAAVAAFTVKKRPTSIRLRRVKQLGDLRDLSGGRLIRRERLEAETRWSRLTHGARECPPGFVELGELCRVHRGQVTGANEVWIAGEHAEDLPGSVLFPSVTKAREIIGAGSVLADATKLRRVIDLPEDLGMLEKVERRIVERFLRYARKRGAHQGYIARHRRAWWAVGLRQPAPILATYMARRAPAFARNLASARHLNIAHGIYPRERMTERMLSALVAYLSTGTNVVDGRTYAGGLTKFEPGEMERIFVPGPTLLAAS